MVWKTGRQSSREQPHSRLGSRSQPLTNWYVQFPDSLNCQRQLLTECINICSFLPKAKCGLCHFFYWALPWLILFFWLKGWEVLLLRELGCALLTNSSGPPKAEFIWWSMHKQDLAISCCCQPLRWNPGFPLHFFLLAPVTQGAGCVKAEHVLVLGGRSISLLVVEPAWSSHLMLVHPLSIMPTHSSENLLFTLAALLAGICQDIYGPCSGVLLLSKALTCNWL